MSARTLGVLILAVAIAGSAAAQQPSKEDRVRELLVVMRAGDMGLQIVDQLIGTMKQSIPGAPEEFWVSFRKKVKSEDLVATLVPVYARNLESEDVEEMIRFFRTPAGQRFLDKQPVILRESMEAGRTWGEKLALQAIEELQKNKPNG